MKNILFATTALITLSASSAFAADLAARPYTKAAPPMMVAVYDWTGFYVGVNGGYGTSRKCLDFQTAGVPVADNCHDADGAVAGGQIGYRWQYGSMVYGIEGQGDYANIRGGNVSNLLPTVTRGTRVDAFGLFTGQIGYAFGPALLYVKGGGAVVGQRYESYVTTAGAGSVGSITGLDTRFGATVGAGLEYAITPTWSVGVDYNHLFLGTTTYTYPNPTFTERARGDLDVVTARINYKWGGPVVARY